VKIEFSTKFTTGTKIDKKLMNPPSIFTKLTTPVFSPGTSRPESEAAAVAGWFWDFVAGFRWRDRSDGPVESARVEALIRGLDPTTYRDFAQCMTNFGAVLKLAAGKKIGEPSEAVIAHVIARGREFYLAVLENPDLMMYLIEHHEEQIFTYRF
jgi:hypothetical protein